MPWGGTTNIRDWKNARDGKTGMRGVVYTGKGGTPIMYDDNPTSPISIGPLGPLNAEESERLQGGQEKVSPRMQGPQFHTAAEMQSKVAGDSNTDIVREVPTNGNGNGNGSSILPASFAGFLEGEIIPGIKNMWLLGGLIVWIAINEYGIGGGKGKKWFS